MTNSAPRLLAIVPAFNEEEAIGATIRTLKANAPGFDILVVNDGSKDHTSQVVRETGLAAVIDLPINLGIGGAVQTGFKYATRQGYDLAVQFDADGQHLAEEVEKLIAPVLAGAADVVLGSRFLGVDTYKSTALRRVGIRIFRLVNSLLIKQSITDNTSGFRAYNRQALEFLSEYYPSDYPEPEAVILLGRNGFTIREIAVAMQERQGGVTSINLRRSAYYMVKVLLAIIITYFRDPIPQMRR